MQPSNHGNGTWPQGRKTNPNVNYHNKPRNKNSRGKRNTEEIQENHRAKERLDWLRNQLGGYYTDEILKSTLIQFNQDTEKARQHLLNQRQNSWSSKVKPTPHYHTVAENNQKHTQIHQQVIKKQAQNVKPNYHEKQHRKNQSNNNVSVPTKALDDYNDEKIDAIQIALANQLTVVVTKKEKLQNLNNEIKTIIVILTQKLGS